MIFAAILAAVTIAFPREGAKLPSLSRCYLIGATDGGEASLALRAPRGERSAAVSVSVTGAWGTLVEVQPGTNVVVVGDCRRTFFVEPAADKRQAEPAKRYSKLEYAADEARPHPTGKRPDELTIVIDPGHGGADAGAISPHGLGEKDANLRLAKEVAGALGRRGVKVILTRTNDVAVALYDRPKVAHAVGADALVSIHHNAPGYETDPTRSRYQAVYAWNALGDRLAEAIATEMALARPQIEDRGVIHANFAVTRNPEIPSCLIEADFITHPDGEAAAWDVAIRARLAEAIAEGVMKWMR